MPIVKRFYQALAYVTPIVPYDPAIGQAARNQPWSEPVRTLLRLHPALNPFEVRPISPSFPEQVNAAMFAPPWSIPVRERVGTHASKQPFFTISPTALMIAESILIDRWLQPWSLPVWRRDVPTAQQRAATISAQPIPLTPTFQGYLIA